jgi:SPP1 family predicted phage head-tail adaptor
MSLLTRGNIDPGKLDRRIVIQSPTTTRDAGGGVVRTWSTLATVWAERTFLSGGRLFAAAAKNSEATVLFRIRYLGTVRAFMRVVHGQATYEIVAPPVELGRRHLMELECRAINQAAVPVPAGGGDFDSDDFDPNDFDT